MRSCPSRMMVALLGGWLAAGWAAGQGLKTAPDRPVDVNHLRLDLKIDLAGKAVDSRATLQVTVLRDSPVIALDAVNFQVTGCQWLAEGAMQAVQVPFRHEKGRLTLTPPGGFKGGSKAALTVAYLVKNPKDGLFFFGPGPGDAETPLMVWSQGESNGNRHWIPCLDHPVERQTTELVATVEKGNEVLSNGRLLSRRDNADNTTTFHWRQENPHPSYLVTLVAGKFDVTEEKAGDIPLLYYVPKGTRGDVAKTFGRTREMMEFFQRRFGTRYPWEKYAQVVVEQFTSGGMENTSATTLNDRVMVDDRALLDYDPDGLIAHELAHQWWGDLVTCRDWAHLWLNEGFASFSEVIWAEHHQGLEKARYDLLRKMRSALEGDSRPIVDRRYGDPRDMFDNRVYPKGAWMLQMLRSRLGEEVFWQGVRSWAERYRFKSAETADFRRVLEETSGLDLERFFTEFLEKGGHPELKAEVTYNAGTRMLEVKLEQTQKNEPYDLKIPLEIILENGQRVVEVLPLAERKATTRIKLDQPPATWEFDPHFTVLAAWTEKREAAQWVALANKGGVHGRSRAIDALGAMNDQSEALATLVAREKVPGLAAEAAAALGRQKDPQSLKRLVQAVALPEAKVRRAAVEALGRKKADEEAKAALRKILDNGDPSAAVEASALLAYARVGGAPAQALAAKYLVRESHGEVLRTAALDALAETGGNDAVDTLLAWTAQGKPRAARLSAMRAAASLADKSAVSGENRKRIVEMLMARLDGEKPQIRRAAALALDGLGEKARPALARLELAVSDDPDNAVRRNAEKALRHLNTKSDSGSMQAEIRRLRAEVEALKQKMTDLEDPDAVD
jgi:aminopeptidase N